MYHFEGDYRRRPQQSLRGASTKDEKEALIKRAQGERKKRENQRLKVASCITLQAFVRGTLARIAVKNTQRQAFDSLIIDVKKTGMATSSLPILLHKLLIFYKEQVDSQRLVALCQLLLKNPSFLTDGLLHNCATTLYRIKRLLYICCSNILHSLHPSQPIAVQLRMLEIYTGSKMYALPAASSPLGDKRFLENVLNYLVSRNYYECIRELLQTKVPSSLDYTVTPPSPIAATLLDLTTRPIAQASTSENVDFKKKTFVSLCQQLLCGPLLEQVSQFLLPALTAQPSFPFGSFVAALICEKKGLVIFPTPWLLYSVLTLGRHYLKKLTYEELLNYLRVLQHLSNTLQLLSTAKRGRGSQAADSDSEDENKMIVDDDQQLGSLQESTVALQSSMELINESEHVQTLLSILDHKWSSDTMDAFCQICHNVMGQSRLSVQKHRLLYTIAFNPAFLHQLWRNLVTMATPTITRSKSLLLQLLSRGVSPDSHDCRRIFPQLSLFCALFSIALLTLHDDEFYQELETGSPKAATMAFSLQELVSISTTLRDVSLGLLELTHPQSLHQNYLRITETRTASTSAMTLDDWCHMFKMVSQLVRQLYARDTRRPFCPRKHWIAQNIVLQADRPKQLFLYYQAGVLQTHSTAVRPSAIEDLPPLTVTDARNLTILTELPFVVPFEDRVKIFQQLIHCDKEDNHRERDGFNVGPSIHILVRRNYLYEDAYEKLSPENEPNLKLRMRVQLVNFAGLDEAGIDGGGIFREFLSVLLKTCFDPNRGFFRTTHDRLLYPNPHSPVLFDNYRSHYYFIGRMLGKALYENMLVELPFAGFFLAKILSKHMCDVDIHHLASLDPVMYKNLLYLKTYEGDVSDLALDFTVINDELGETRVEELKPGGRDIIVSSANKIEYIHLLADYKLNRQIRAHCHAFKQGLADVIDLEWLQMFDYRELQVLISGARVPIDVGDLRRHITYSGGYSDDHTTILSFWRVVDNFDEQQKRQLLKFITSCSRPPLLGFKELFPPICIQNTGTEDRLPSASTCMNLLKLPQFKSEEVLKERLLYAIESGAGFELS